MESICCVCKKIYGGSHNCFVCKLPCHTFCGDSGGVENEGYGGKVMCNNCINERRASSTEDLVTVVEEHEPQNNENEDTPMKAVQGKKRYRSNEAVKKLEAIEWARKNSIRATAKKFRVGRNVIRGWMKNEIQLRKQIMSPNGGKRKRLEGGGRPIHRPNIDIALVEWIKEMRENKLPVSRNIIRQKAASLFVVTDIKASVGWLDKFLKRHDFVLRKKTSVCQKPPLNYAEVVAKFIIFVEQRRKKMNNFPGGIFAMDETAVWFDCPDSRCVDKKGAKDVTVVTTGHEKMRVTVCLTARSNGQKLKPYVLVNRKRPLPRIVDKFSGMVINFAGSIWMNDETTEDFLHKIIGAKLFVGDRLLVWDAFGSHKSERTAKVAKGLGVEMAFVPGGCTKFIQAPDVSWNKPFKERIRYYYNIWMTNDAEKEFTRAGNPKAPALEVVLEWIDRSWQEISKDVIIKSFEVCGLTTPLDGTGDDKIACFKPEGMIGPRGIQLLRQFRANETTKDGRNDYEADGLSDDDVNLESVEDDDELLIY